MNPGNNYTYISTNTTTIIGGSTSGIRRVNLCSILVNKTLTGTVTVKSGTTTIGIIAIGSLAGTYWLTSGFGVEVADLQIVTSASDDVTITWNNI